MKKQGQYETEVKVSFDNMDMYWILYRFSRNLRSIFESNWRQLWMFGASTANLDDILESQTRLDLRSEEDTCFALVFSKYKL